MQQGNKTWYVWIALGILLLALVAWSYLPQTFDDVTGVCWRLAEDRIRYATIDDQIASNPSQTAQKIAALYSPYLYRKIPLGRFDFTKEFPNGLQTRSMFITLERPLAKKQILFLHPLGDKLMTGNQVYQILPLGANLGLPLDGPGLDDLEQGVWLL